MLILEAAMVGVFAATDVFLFYVFFEAMLIPMYFIIGSFGAPGPKRTYAAVKFLLYSLFGGLLMLAAVIGLYVLSTQQLRHGTFDFDTLRGLHITPDTQKLLFLGFFVAFAIKAPLFPFHTWLARRRCRGADRRRGAAGRRAGQGRHLRADPVLHPAVPECGEEPGPAGAGVGRDRHLLRGAAGHGPARPQTIGVLHLGGPLRLHRAGHLRADHPGRHRCGAVHGQPRAFDRGAVLHRRLHGVPARRRATRRRSAAGERRPRCCPRAFLIAGLSSLALPGLSTFVGEFLVLVGTFTRYRALAIVATVGIVLAALYILLMYQRTMQGPFRVGHG